MSHILYYPHPEFPLVDDYWNHQLTPKEYGQKLLNRKRGK